MLYIPYEQLTSNNYHLISTHDELNKYAEYDKYFHVYHYEIRYSLSFNCIKKDKNIFFYACKLTNQIFRIKENIVSINDIYIKRILIPITEYCILSLQFNRNIINEIIIYDVKDHYDIICTMSIVDIKKIILCNCMEYASNDKFLIYCDNLLNKLGSMLLLHKL